MTETTLTREDTGEFLPVRVAEPETTEPPASQTPIFDSMADHPGAGDEWRRQAGLSRARFDGMGIADVEVQLTSVQWAELPDEVRDPANYYEVARRMSSDPQVRAAIDRAEQDEPDPVTAYMAAGDPDPRPGRWVNVAEDDLLPARIVQVGDTNLPRRNDTFEGRFVPDPADYGPHEQIAGHLVVKPNITADEAAEIKRRWRELYGKQVDIEIESDHGPVDRWLERADTRLRQSRFGRWLGERFTPVKEER